jgi:hypothetical protein
LSIVCQRGSELPDDLQSHPLKPVCVSRESIWPENAIVSALVLGTPVSLREQPVSDAGIGVVRTNRAPCAAVCAFSRQTRTPVKTLPEGWRSTAS